MGLREDVATINRIPSKSRWILEHIATVILESSLVYDIVLEGDHGYASMIFDFSLILTKSPVGMEGHHQFR